MGRPPGKIHDRPFQMRVSDSFLTSVDKWRTKQEDEPSRAEAIRRLVELGLGGARQRGAHKGAAKAKTMAREQVERMIDPAAPEEERQRRRRRLLKGPEEFREMRADLPKPKR
jgi:hypothetical protein